MKKTKLQQGDVILTKIESLPLGATKRKPDSRGIVLAEGEATGHFHGIKEPSVHIYEQNGEVFLVNESGKPVALEHQEHGPVTVDPGVWSVGGVREFDYLQEMERRVWHVEGVARECSTVRRRTSSMSTPHDDDYPETCPDCHGEGWILTCIDDICHGQGFCMHGDGERTCPTCKGEGQV